MSKILGQRPNLYGFHKKRVHNVSRMREKIFIELNETKESVQTILLRLLDLNGRGKYDGRIDAVHLQYSNDL